MGRLTYSMIVSLDGFVNGPDGSFDWAAPDEELHSYFNERERPVGTYVYGRRMYETMRYWQDSAVCTDPISQDFATIWQAASKVVVSQTLSEPTTPKTELWETFDADRLANLVRESDGEVSIGGPTLAAAALRAGLVAEVTACVVPYLAGGGLRWLPDAFASKLALREQRSFAAGAVLLGYDVVP